ncbi:hypothetical protein M758_UG123000 [Ceratodon purpureus]|nr:hypothetical protein M758_UG123000 [Ceratodon purpureus]
MYCFTSATRSGLFLKLLWRNFLACSMVGSNQEYTVQMFSLWACQFNPKFSLK